MTKRKNKKVEQKKTFKTKDSFWKTIYNHLISGIGYMIPIIVASGVIFAISYLIDTCAGVKPGEGVAFGQTTVAAQIFHYVGDAGLGLMFSIMAAFIARSIAGNRGFAPGFLGGLMSRTGAFSIMFVILASTKGWSWDAAKAEWVGQWAALNMSANALASCATGFIGAIVAGFGAGYIVKAFAKLLKNMKGSWSIVRDIMIIPIVCSMITVAGMFLLNAPLAFINIGINKLLGVMITVNALIYIVAGLVAALMCIDMGGPINKAAHFFCLSLVTQSDLRPAGFTEQMAWALMAANIVGIMVPPVSISIASWLFPKKFSKEDRLPSIGNCFVGFCGVTEPAIPFVAKDPVRVILSCVIGAFGGGVLSYAIGGMAIAPEGGIFSLVTMITNGGWQTLLATIAAAFLSAICLGISKKTVDPKVAKLGKWKGIPIGKGIGK